MAIHSISAFILLGVLSIAQVSFAESSCLDMYRDKGLQEDSAAQALDCYEKSEKNSDQQNQISYLQFFISEHELAADSPESNASLQSSFNTSKQNVSSFGKFLDYESYKDLDPAQSRILSRALYIYGITLARIAEKKGVMEVMNKWPEIQKVMKLIMRLKNADVEFYGAYRTLAIAHTRMPALFGDKKLAKEYFELIAQKTETRDGLSAFLDNNLFYSEFLLSQGQKDLGCQLLKKTSAVTDAEIQAWSPDHMYESLKARSLAAAQLQEKCPNTF